MRPASVREYFRNYYASHKEAFSQYQKTYREKQGAEVMRNKWKQYQAVSRLKKHEQKTTDTGSGETESNFLAG